ncbi:MAG: tRNA (guanine-N7-)-methyltransferase, partial [Halieaceae bacterium]
MIEPPKSRRIRSFVLRSGRMTEAQQRAYDENWDQWGLEHNDGVLDVNTAFGRDADTVLEIGFGMGQSLVTMAAQS